MQKIKILLAITKGNWGGAQKYVYDLATNLPAESYLPIVLCGTGHELPNKLSAQAIRIIQLPRLKRDIGIVADVKTFFTLLQLLRRERPDIIHINSSKIGGLGALAGRLTKVPKIIFTAHGWPFNEERPGIVKFFIKLASWLTVMLSHQTITVSEFDRQQLLSWPGMKSKLITIHNGIDKIDFLTRAEARKKLGLKEHDWVAGTIAELHKNKGLKYLPTGTLVIGNGEERFKLEKSLRLFGHIPDVAKLLKAFDIFVLPSIKEGLPYVLLEAGLAGLPVVATWVGGIPEIIDPGVTGLLVEPKNRLALSQAINTLQRDSNLATRLGANLAQKIKGEFSTADMVKQTLTVYNQ